MTNITNSYYHLKIITRERGHNEKYNETRFDCFGSFIYITNNDKCIHASVNTASFVGNSYQYILNSKIGKLYVISGETSNPFKVGEEVFLSLDEKDVKVLND